MQFKQFPSELLLLILQLVAGIENDGNIQDFFKKTSAGNDDFVPKVSGGKTTMRRRGELEAGECTLEMFSNNSAAYWACSAQFALQRNWFPDPIQGLFSYQSWNGMDGFWQNGVVLESMANAMQYLNNTRYLTVVSNSLRDLESLLLAYGPQPSFDDMGWYGLAYTRIAEVTSRKGFLHTAAKIFDWIWDHGWDTGTCGGGVWFDQTEQSKSTIENVQLIQLGGRLARLGAGEKYKAKAETAWMWLRSRGILNATSFQVYDDVNLTTCKANQSTTWTYTAGTLVGGLVELSKLRKGKEAKSTLATAHNVSHAVIKRLTNTHGGLVDPCETGAAPPCNLDQSIFKGIFARNLRYLMDISPISKRRLYSSFLSRNIASLKQNSMCEISVKNSSHCHLVYLNGGPAYPATGPVFGVHWSGPFMEGRPIQQTSALDLLLSGVKGKVVCKGVGCSFDPHPPPPRPLSCKNAPRPT